MERSCKSILGEGPFPFSLESPQENVKIYTDARIIILNTPDLHYGGAACHAHSSYEFTFPYSDMIPCQVGRKRLTMEKSKVFPFNPEQEHGPTKQMQGLGLAGVMVDKHFLQDISHTIYRKAEVNFHNESSRYSNEIQAAIITFMKEYKNHQSGYEFIMESLSIQIVVEFLRNLRSNIPNSVTERNYIEKVNINRAVDYLTEYYNMNYSLDALAQVANLSPYHFIRVFKSQTGKTPYDFLLSIKVEKACQMLKNNEKTITEVCYSCGFSNSSHFTTVFKKKTGVSPSEYRRNLTLNF